MQKMLYNAIVLLLLVVTITESRIHLERGLLSNADIESAYQPHPYYFPQAGRGRAAIHRGFEIADEDVEYDEDALDGNDKWLDDENKLQIAAIKPETQQNSLKIHNLSWSSDKSGSILVPDGIIEVEGQTVYDEKTGKATLLVAKEALDAIPNGSVVALLDSVSAVNSKDEETEEERANRVLVRRRKKGSKINVRAGNKRRRTGNNNMRNRNRRGNKNRSRRPTVHVYNPNYRQSNRRRRPSRVTPIIVRG